VFFKVFVTQEDCDTLANDKESPPKPNDKDEVVERSRRQVKFASFISNPIYLKLKIKYQTFKNKIVTQ
jgi:hypothetical protein